MLSPDGYFTLLSERSDKFSERRSEGSKYTARRCLFLF